MSSLIWARHRQGVLFIWLVSLLYLMWAGNYLLFLRAEFGVILALGAIILLALFKTEFDHPRGGHFSLLSAVRILLILLPLAYLPIANNSSLGLFALETRSIGELYSTLSLPSSLPSKVDKSDTLKPPVDISKTSIVLLSELLEEPAKYLGQSVSVMGMGMGTYSELLSKELGGNYFVLFRFSISCCAADALPFTIVVQGQLPKHSTKNQWLKVQGVFSILKHNNNKQIPIITNATTSATNPPRQPYLY